MFHKKIYCNSNNFKDLDVFINNEIYDIIYLTRHWRTVSFLETIQITNSKFLDILDITEVVFKFLEKIALDYKVCYC